MESDRLDALALEFMRVDLTSFVRGMKIPGVPASRSTRNPVDDAERVVPAAGFSAHHLLWLRLLQQVESGGLKRLMGLMPPGSAKSTYTSVVFPAHIMGRFRDTQVLVASYAGGQPRRWGRRGVRLNLFAIAYASY
jgi:hypothetical protein